MCNCKGWDIAYFPNRISIEPHFCRTYGDCGSEDRGLDEAADEVVHAYDREYEWCIHMMEDGNSCGIEQTHLDKLKEQAGQWHNRTHPDYLYYSQDTNNE